ncbi:competence protein ComGC [Staphylococcus hominis]
MKNRKGLGLGIALIAIMLIVSIILIIVMLNGHQKETYYGYMKDSHTIDKMVNEQTEKVEKNVKLPSDTEVKVTKGDFVFLVKEKGSNSFSRVSKVSHDDVPHGLMMKIHEMHDMKGM